MKTLKVTVTAATLLLLAAAPVSALSIGENGEVRTRPVQTASTSLGAEISIQARIGNAKDRAFREIDRRIAALKGILTRVQAMVRLTSEQKVSIGDSLQNQVDALTELRAKISADSDLETLKSDIKSIASGYRIYLLIIPQAHISIAADRLKWVVESETQLATKLKVRIDSATSSGTDASAAEALYTDMQVKIADANAQADAALSIIANLKPDNGDKAKASTNEEALKEARTKIKAGLQAAKDARQIAREIVNALRESRADDAISETAL
jgi:hypothetical protein